MGARFAEDQVMKLIGLKMGLTLGALALAGCANDKPAADASQTTTTSARAPDGLMSSNANDTNATGASTNESPDPSMASSSGVVTTTSTKGTNAGSSMNGATASGATSDTSVPQTRAHGNDAHAQTWGGGTGSNATPAPASNGNAAGASQPGVTAPPPPQNQNGGNNLTPIDQGNNASDLKVTQQIRKQVVSDSSLSFAAKNVKIITVNGRVTLKGQVNSDNEKKWIEATADKVVGNANVDNQITIKQ